MEFFQLGYFSGAVPDVLFVIHYTELKGGAFSPAELQAYHRTVTRLLNTINVFPHSKKCCVCVFRIAVMESVMESDPSILKNTFSFISY